MPTLKSILAEHQQYAPRQSLKKNLGDGYLMTHNPVFRAIRLEALKHGFKFTSDRFYHYDVLALTQLPRILKCKMIPYRDNVAPLKEVEQRAPGIFQFDQLPKLQPNHVFHESAHAVGRSIIEKTLARPETHREHALHLLLEESFANACESLANLHSQSTLHDEFLYKNSYIMESPKTREILAKAILDAGQPAVFQTLIFSFLYANMIQARRSQQDWKRVTQLVQNKSLSLRGVFRIGHDLDERFTLFTNAFCLRLAGIEQEFFDLLEFDFLTNFERDQRYQQCLMSFVRSLG